jgi:DNA-binding response OmpR family regulator
MHSATGEVWAGTRQVVLTPAELAVLELLMKNRGQGVTTEAIVEAANLDAGSDEGDDPDAIVAKLRRKTGIRGRGPSVRKERVQLYFFGDDEGAGTAG